MQRRKFGRGFKDEAVRRPGKPRTAMLVEKLAEGVTAALRSGSVRVSPLCKP